MTVEVAVERGVPYGPVRLEEPATEHSGVIMAEYDAALARGPGGYVMAATPPAVD